MILFRQQHDYLTRVPFCERIDLVVGFIFVHRMKLLWFSLVVEWFVLNFFFNFFIDRYDYKLSLLNFIGIIGFLWSSSTPHAWWSYRKTPHIFARRSEIWTSHLTSKNIIFSAILLHLTTVYTTILNQTIPVCFKFKKIRSTHIIHVKSYNYM